jgi:tRNA A37 threonylcarbamoyladenosine dehydratase
VEERFIRQEMLLGRRAMNTLSDAHVAVFGLGGVGGYAAEALARGGIGELTLIDQDVFGISNINRQIGALNSTIGKKKAEVMAERAHGYQPELEGSCGDRTLQRTQQRLFFGEPL